jgi:TolA-binding protein
MNAYFNEISTIILAVIAGLWTLVKTLTYVYDKLQARIAKLENESITRKEVQQWVAEMRKTMESQQTHLDKKLDRLDDKIAELLFKERLIQHEMRVRDHKDHE